MFSIGDLVTRKSYDNDVIFKILKIDGNNCLLMGTSIRLSADAPLEDLVKYVKDDCDDFSPNIEGYRNLLRESYFYLPGRIVHVDMDDTFLEKCMRFYKKNRLKAFGILSNGENLDIDTVKAIRKYHPDIVVITGHDSFNRKRKTNEKYMNSDIFVQAVKMARKEESSHEKLVIIAGACQSNYEELIKAGANFASSPKRINIHALDPAIIASCLAFSDKNNNIDLIKILDKTKYGSDGIGGIITKGTMYIGYPR